MKNLTQKRPATSSTAGEWAKIQEFLVRCMVLLHRCIPSKRSGARGSDPELAGVGRRTVALRTLQMKAQISRVMRSRLTMVPLSAAEVPRLVSGSPACTDLHYYRYYYTTIIRFDRCEVQLYFLSGTETLRRCMYLLSGHQVSNSPYSIGPIASCLCIGPILEDDFVPVMHGRLGLVLSSAFNVCSWSRV